jgi:hypothetical protein
LRSIPDTGRKQEGATKSEAGRCQTPSPRTPNQSQRCGTDRIEHTKSVSEDARTRIVDLNIHDLRREFGSRLLESGAGIHDVSYWLSSDSILSSAVPMFRQIDAGNPGPVSPHPP